MAKLDTKLNFTPTFELPDFTSLENLATLNYGQWAVAIDGDVVATSAGSSSEAPDLPTTPAASTAKMILALAVMQKKPFELGESGETITISQEFYDRYAWYIARGGSTSAVAVGEQISEYDALMSVMLVSSNNLADNLAVWAFGSLNAYREYASGMLKNWGLTHTTLGDDASGFSPSTTSTASDLALIGQKVLENPVLAEIVSTKKHTVPAAGELTNTNQLLGELGVIGVKTGWIGDVSGYQLISAYRIPEKTTVTEGSSESAESLATDPYSHIVTITVLGAPTRNTSFVDSRVIISALQSRLLSKVLVAENAEVGYVDSWWTGRVPIRAKTAISALAWQNLDSFLSFDVPLAEPTVGGDQSLGQLRLTLASRIYETDLLSSEFCTAPSLWQRFLHLFGWRYESNVDEVNVNDGSGEEPNDNDVSAGQNEGPAEETTAEQSENSPEETGRDEAPPKAGIASLAGNCTTKYGTLSLINPNFTVDTNFIAARKPQLISISTTFGIPEYHLDRNGDNLLDAEAATHLNDMLKAYSEAYPGHSMGTYSCFRSRGTQCGRLCAATGTSDHHTGYTCDLIDLAYGTELDTDDLASHLEWQWLKQNSYKFGFIDRFPEAWAGGSMSEPLNVDANGSTGLYETWHYRYVGITAATEIATGKYNDGAYDSLEHYLLARGLVKNLKAGTCE